MGDTSYYTWGTNWGNPFLDLIARPISMSHDQPGSLSRILVWLEEKPPDEGVEGEKEKRKKLNALPKNF
jgi:hypothetical protein